MGGVRQGLTLTPTARTHRRGSDLVAVGDDAVAVLDAHGDGVFQTDVIHNVRHDARIVQRRTLQSERPDWNTML